jgi:multidrug resistance efflux pump
MPPLAKIRGLGPIVLRAIRRPTDSRLKRISAMLIIATLYAILLWLVFARLKLIRLGWVSGTLAALGGAFILAAFVAMFNYLTPSGNFVIVARVVEVTPEVGGQIVEIPVQPNVPVKAGTVLFQIDPAPYKYKVEQLSASLAQAKQQVLELKAGYVQATASVDGLEKQLAFHTKRLADYQQMVSDYAQTEFRLQDTQVQQETVAFQLQAARAAQVRAKLAMDSEINGTNTTVANIEAQLANAQWELEQTTVRALGDGYVTLV